MSTKVLSIGIDVGSQKLDVCFLGKDSQRHKTFTNDEEGVNNLLNYIKEMQIELQPIVMESTGSYHWKVALTLSKHNYNLKVINPIITKKYRRSSIRNTKTDKIDAARLAEIGLLEKDLPNYLDSNDILLDKQYQSLLKKLVHIRQQIAAALKAAESSSKEIDVTIDLAPVKLVFDNINEAIKALQLKITENTSQLAINLANKTKGLSLFQASVLCNATVYRKFDNRNQLIAFFGLDIRQNASGTWQGKQRLSKRGNSFFRLILFQAGWTLKNHNPLYQEYYKRQREVGNKHYVSAVLATTRKFLRYYFKELKEYQKTHLLAQV